MLGRISTRPDRRAIPTGSKTSAVGFVTFGSEHRRYVTANKSFQLMTGYTEDELRNLTPLDITHEDDRAALRIHADPLVSG